MRLSQVFHFKHKRIYALPTGLGVVFFALLGIAFSLSAFFHDPLEQWFCFLMIFFTLIHLLEASEPFRSVDLEIPPFDPFFARRMQSLRVVLHNSSKSRCQPLWLKFDGDSEWVRVSSLEAHGRETVFMPLYTDQKGSYRIPSVEIKSIPRSGLFRFWKHLEVEKFFFVMPEPIDWGVNWDQAVKQPDSSSDRSALEEIRDPRLLHRRDEKLFLKTGLSFLRMTEREVHAQSLSLSWASLSGLSSTQKEEQFSFWLERVEKFPGMNGNEVKVATPFFTGSIIEGRFDWSRLKLDFFKWSLNG